MTVLSDYKKTNDDGRNGHGEQRGGEREWDDDEPDMDFESFMAQRQTSDAGSANTDAP